MNPNIIKKLLIKKIPKQVINLGFAMVAFLLAIYLNWSFGLAIISAVFIYSVLDNFRPEFYKNVSIVCAIIAAILMIKDNQSISEALEAISFVSLIIYLVFDFFRIRRENNKA